MARKNDWCVVLDSYPGLLATDWPLYGSLDETSVVLPNGYAFRTSTERHGNIIRVPDSVFLWTSCLRKSNFTGIPAGSLLASRHGEKGNKLIGKYISGKLDTVVEQCMSEYMVRCYWLAHNSISRTSHTSSMDKEFNNFHMDHEPLPEHPLIVIDCSSHGLTTDFILDDTSRVYRMQRLDFFDHTGSLCYSGYVKEIVGNIVTMTDCLHDERHRNYHKMPNEPKLGTVGIEPHMNQLVLVDRYLNGEFNDYIREVMLGHQTVLGYKLPKVHVA